MEIINSIITNTNNVMYGYLLLAVFFVISVFSYEVLKASSSKEPERYPE